MNQQANLNMDEIPDVQNSEDTRQISIDKVGIRDIRHPVVVSDRAGHTQHTIANLNMYVNLSHLQKGTHMSRFVEVLNTHEYSITLEKFRQMLTDMTRLLEAESGYIEMSFPYFVKKAAPVSGVKSLMDYQVTLIGQNIKGEIGITIKIVVPVTSLCPCSRDISERGAHNQRSHVTVTVNVADTIYLEDLIDMVESIASCELYGLLKRPDEKYVTEKAYDNPKFVEDMVRDVAILFNQDDRIRSYRVESENFESIHNHSAYAMLEHSK